MSKSLRIIHVLEVVEALGRGTPKDIQYKVAAKMAVDPEDANFKRNIYRDLRELTDQGKLSVFNFSPDGTPTDLDDEAALKNIRIEYALADAKSDDKILGWKNLEMCGLGFSVSKKNRLLWKANFIRSPAELDNHFSIMIRLLNGEVLALQTPRDELPAKIIIGRSPDVSEADLLNELSEREGIRAAYLMCADSSVSRYVVKQKLGHCRITIDSQARIKVADLQSAHGTKCTEFPPEKLNELWMKRDRAKTSGGAFEDAYVSNQKAATVADMSVNSPCAIKIGTMTLFLCVGSSSKK